MLEELLRARYKKLLKTITQKQQLPSELITVEEAKMCVSFVTFAGEYQKFTSGLMQGQTIKTEAEVKVDLKAEVKADVGHKRITLRFLKNTPTMIGLDMKTYGPFKVEDVASLPAENAKILVKQGLAVLVEVF
jgi:DNA replication initiation complex subunit (GINS family)